MQHIEYKEQLKNKQLILEQSLKRFSSISNVKELVQLALHSHQEYGYQTQVIFSLKNTNFGLTLGFIHPVTNRFIHIDECKVIDQEINQIAQLALKLFRKHKLKAYDRRNREGHLFDLVIRYFKDTDSASVVFVVNENIEALNEIAKEMVEKFQSIQSVGYSIYNHDSHIILYHPVEMLVGPEYLPTHYHDFNIHISPKGVYPIQKDVFEMMDECIVKETTLSKNDTILNLYQYSTLSSLYFSQFVNKVISVDYDDDSIKDAKRNQKALKIKNIEWINSHVESIIKDLLKSGVQVLNVYAPKNGFGYKVYNLIQTYLPKQIVYISENPSTMAKDIDRLLDQYQIRKIIPADLKPQTASIYSMTFLEKK
jgi:23S rRNA (uracil1939-C5)-methyltransferase